MRTTKQTVIALDADDTIVVRFGYLEVHITAVPSKSGEDGQAAVLRLESDNVAFASGEDVMATLNSAGESFKDSNSACISDGAEFTIELV